MLFLSISCVDFLSNPVLHFITQYETLLLSMKLYYSHTLTLLFYFVIIRLLRSWQGYVAGQRRYHVIQQHDTRAIAQEYCIQLALTIH